MKPVSIRAFTLLEVMIVIGLLSIVGSFFALRIAGYLQERAYSVEEEVIEGRYQLAERVATLCETRVTTHLEDGVLTLHSGKQTPAGIKTVMERPTRLKGSHENQERTFAPYGTDTDHEPNYPDEIAPLHPR